MYPALSRIVDQQKLLASGIRLFELVSLSLARPARKKNSNNESLEYFVGLIAKGATVIDIGLHDFNYIHLLRKISKKAGKLVVFEARPESQRYLAKKSESLRINNVNIEQIHLGINNENVFAGRQLCKTGGTTVIDFTQKQYKTYQQAGYETLDHYCEKENLNPDFIRINADGEELNILQGAATILVNHPKLLLTCEERHAGRERILETFQWLAELGYQGYFILGETKIPVANFDFNIYQNPVYDFYCRQFIFE